MDTNLQLSGEIQDYWLTLLHRILHSRQDAVVPVKSGLSSDDSIHCSCDCAPNGNSGIYLILANSNEWFTKIDYMNMCPSNIEEWDLQIKTTLQMCCKQEFQSNTFKIPLENIVFNRNFISTFLNSNHILQKRVIRTITKLLTLTHSEAGSDAGLREENIKGVYRVRVSRGKRIHYVEERGLKKFISLDTESKHDHFL
jgi:hypothetical protein